MRSRAILFGSLFGTVVSAGAHTSCVPSREYEQPNGGDGGETVAVNDAGHDASVTSGNTNPPNGSSDGGSTIGELSVTLGRGDSGIADAAVVGGDAEPTNSTPNEEAGLSESDGTATSAVSDTGESSAVTAHSDSTTSDETSASNMSEDASVSDASTADASTTDGGSTCSPVAQVESECSSDVDEDCDGLFGCEDVEDCAEDPACEPACVAVTDTELDCSDEIDDDCDGFEDCEDPDCVLDEACLVACVPVTEVCDDREDNDCDGFDDCSDSDCATAEECCTAEGVEVCNDGIDNDCDGEIDCPMILAAVPAMPPVGRIEWEGGAVSADMAALTLDRPALEDYVVQCRSAKPSTVASGEFTVCDSANPSSLEVMPFADSDGSDASHDGLITTEVRFAFPNGQVSSVASYTYYVHSSLYGAEPCADVAEDDAYFTFAEPYLVADDGATFDDADARLAAPFVNVAFTPMTNLTFNVADGDGAAEYLSLRRRFVLNANKNMILMKRVYESRTSGVDDCRTATIRKHASNGNNNAYGRAACDAIVLNREGAGLCLRVDESNEITISNPNSASWQYWNFTTFSWVNWAQADNFMWRKLLPDQAGTVHVFSAKCYDGGSDCTGGDTNVIYLPDHELFEP